MKAKRFLGILLLAGIVILAIGCNNGSTDTTYNIGDTGPGGGKVFYDKRDNTGGWRYLEAAPVNQATYGVDGLAWASSSFESTDISGTLTAIGTGKSNTALILATDPDAPAALVCKNYNGGGKNDWFLPSKDELNEFYEQRSIFGIGDPALPYWSSSQDNYYLVCIQNFATGFQGYSDKPNTFTVRAIRAF